jgi:hypothetical protein
VGKDIGLWNARLSGQHGHTVMTAISGSASAIGAALVQTAR